MSRLSNLFSGVVVVDDDDTAGIKYQGPWKNTSTLANEVAYHSAVTTAQFSKVHVKDLFSEEASVSISFTGSLLFHDPLFEPRANDR
jgi:hypothetical protein